MDAKTAARIHALTTTQGWADLTAVLEEQEEKFWKTHITDVKDPNKRIDQRDLDRSMGKLDGIRAILRVPEKADRILRAVNDSEEKDSE